MAHIQVSNEQATSEVLVELDKHGMASYEIEMPCAWDNIVLLEQASNTFFDVNVRPPQEAIDFACALGSIIQAMMGNQ